MDRIEDEYFQVFPATNQIDLNIWDKDNNLLTGLRYDYQGSVGAAMVHGWEYTFKKKSDKRFFLMCNQSVIGEIRFDVEDYWGRLAYIHIHDKTFVLKSTWTRSELTLIDTHSATPTLHMKCKIDAEEKDNWFVRLFLTDRHYLVRIVDRMMDRQQVLLLVVLCGFCVQIFNHLATDESF